MGVAFLCREHLYNKQVVVKSFWEAKKGPIMEVFKEVMTMARVAGDGTVSVKSIRSDQFVQVPRLDNPDQVTLQEEDRITAFYGGGHLYAMPMRSEPLIWV